MALINCIECEGKMSDQASSCPHCGAPATLSTKKEKVDENKIETKVEKERVVYVQPPQKKTNYIKRFIIWIFVIAVLGIIGVLSYDFYMKNSGIENRVNYEIQKHRIKNNDGVVDQMIENHEERVDERARRKAERKKRRQERWN